MKKAKQILGMVVTVPFLCMCLIGLKQAIPKDNYILVVSRGQTLEVERCESFAVAFAKGYAKTIDEGFIVILEKDKYFEFEYVKA